MEVGTAGIELQFITLGSTIASFYTLDDWLVWDGRVSGSSVANNGLYIVIENGGSSKSMVLFDTSTGPEITVSGSGTILAYSLSKYAFINTYVVGRDGNIIRYAFDDYWLWDGRTAAGSVVVLDGPYLVIINGGAIKVVAEITYTLQAF